MRNDTDQDRSEHRVPSLVILLWWIPGLLSVLFYVIDYFYFPSAILRWAAEVLALWFWSALYVALLFPGVINRKIAAAQDKQREQPRRIDQPLRMTGSTYVYLLFAVPCTMACFLFVDRLIMRIPPNAFATHALLIIGGALLIAIGGMLRSRVASILGFLLAFGFCGAFFAWVLYFRGALLHPATLLPLSALVLASIALSLFIHDPCATTNAETDNRLRHD